MTETFVYPPGVDEGWARWGGRDIVLAAGWLTFDGTFLRMHEPDARVFGEIDMRRRFWTSQWRDRGAWVCEVKQRPSIVVFTERIDRAHYIATEILRLGDPARWFD